MEEKGFSAFQAFIRGRSVSLIGAGISNLPLVSFLYDCGAKKVIVRDLRKKENDPEIQSVLADRGSVVLGEGYLNDLTEDVIIRSPGIRPDIPPFVKAVEAGSYLTCETELFMRFVPCRSIAITGSDGKTTTTTLTAKILEAEGYRVFLGGNIGRSMLPQLKEIKGENCISVSELSSFQLMHCRYSPDISIITNLAENHLDWHRDMDEYLEAKKNILCHQSKSGIAILNFDNAHTRSCRSNGATRYFSYDSESMLSEIEEDQEAVFYQDSMIYHRKNGISSPLLPTDSILLPGKHNVENYMAAIAAIKDLVSLEAICKVAESFGGVEHRIELCRELCGVKFYNSSIDSSPSRSIAALRAFDQKVIMIAGGYDKNLDYTPLGDEICEHVKALILCGATSEKIKKAVLASPLHAASQIKIIDCPDFDQTAKIAKEIAKAGDTVILSPASASFDLFKNFEERGRHFKKLVSEL